MKSSVKIAYEGSGLGGKPVIKFITPKTGYHTPGYSESDEQDEDPRDVLMKDFLHCPTLIDRNGVFRLGTYFSTNIGEITTIEPVVGYTDQMYFFRHQVLNKHVPYDTIVHLNRYGIPDRNIVQEDLKWNDIDRYIKIHEFFDELIGNKKNLMS